MGYIIYMQDRRGSKVSQALRQILTEKGAIVPSIEHIGNRLKFANSVRYFHEEDKVVANRVQKILLDALNPKQVSDSPIQLPIQYIAGEKVPLGQLEVWLNL